MLRAQAIETGRRDIDLDPVDFESDASIADLLRGYTSAELEAVRERIPQRPEPQLVAPVPRRVTVSGTVFEDTDGDGKRDPDENGLREVLVSDSATVRRTDGEGRFTLSFDVPDEPHYLFVFATRPYRLSSDELLLLPRSVRRVGA